MRTAAPGTGSPPDVLNALVIQLKGCADLRALEYRWPRIARTLEGVVRRVGATRHRGGSTAAVAGPLGWLDQVVRDHPALQGPAAEPLRAELLLLIGRIRHLARA